MEVTLMHLIMSFEMLQYKPSTKI